MDRDRKFLYKNRWVVLSQPDGTVVAEAWTREELEAEGWRESTHHSFVELYKVRR